MNIRYIYLIVFFLVLVSCQNRPKSETMQSILIAHKFKIGIVHEPILNLKTASKLPSDYRSFEHYRLPKERGVEDDFGYTIYVNYDKLEYWIVQVGGIHPTCVIFGPGMLP